MWNYGNNIYMLQSRVGWEKTHLLCLYSVAWKLVMDKVRVRSRRLKRTKMNVGFSRKCKMVSPFIFSNANVTRVSTILFSRLKRYIEDFIKRARGEELNETEVHIIGDKYFTKFSILISSFHCSQAYHLKY